MNAVRVPRVRVAYHVAMGAAAALGLAAFAVGTAWPGGLGAGLGIFVGLLFLGLRLQSAQAPNRPAVDVGGKIIDFIAPDVDGKPLALSSLEGRPFLLKFFRGHW